MSLRELVARGVDRPFARVLTAPGEYHRNLETIIAPTDWEYRVPTDAKDIVPLWAFNSDTHVRWTRSGAHEYVHLNHDDPEWWLIAVSEQGVKAELWRQWCEFQDDESETRRFSEAIGFEHWRAASEIRERSYDVLAPWIMHLQA